MKEKLRNFLDCLFIVVIILCVVNMVFEDKPEEISPTSAPYCTGNDCGSTSIPGHKYERD